MKTYYMLTKPGIIMGNLITTAGGFALASKGYFDFFLFFITLLGLGLVIASAGVFNNYIDREMDAKMERTRNRPLVKGTVSVCKALIFASILGIAGGIILGLGTNLLTLVLAIIGFVFYLVLYAFFKYHSFYGTLIGSISGAIPPIVGYCAVSNHFDLGALILFLMMVLWQMPHFFAIAIYRYDDYAAASIPVLPVEKGMLATKIQITLYIIAFMLISFMLTLAGYTGSIYALLVLLLGSSWLALSFYGFRIGPSQNKAWGRQMFIVSLVVIMTLFVSLPFDTIS